MGRPAFRLRLRAPRSVDPTEATILTPIGGAPHGYAAAFATTWGLRANLLDNPELAASAAGWGVNVASGARVAGVANPLGAAAVYRVTTTNVDTSGPFVRLASGNGYGVTAGVQYAFIIHVEGTGAVGKQMRLRPHWYNAGGSFLSASTLETVTLAAGWQCIAGVAVAPADAATGLLALYTVGAQGVFTIDVVGAFVANGGAVGAVEPGSPYYTTAGLYNPDGFPYLPLLDLPEGRRGTLDLLNRKIKPGSMTLRLLDRRITRGGDNALRIVTGFLGGASGEPRLLGLLAEVDVTEDADANVVTWERYFTGRVERVSSEGMVALALEITDGAAELNAPVFVGRPSSTAATYAGLPQVWPLGPSIPFGNVPAAAAMTGAIAAAPSGGGQAIVLDADSLQAKTNRLSDVLYGSDVPVALIGSVPAGEILESTQIEARVTHLSGGTAGTVADYAVRGLTTQAQTAEGLLEKLEPLVNGFRIRSIYLAAKPGGVAVPANGTLVSVALVRVGAEPSRASPILIGDVHPVTHLRHVVGGHFGRLSAAQAPLRALPENAAANAALEADASFGTIRTVIDRGWKMSDYLEGICRQVGLAYRLDEFGRVTFYDVRPPTTLAGLPTLGTSDVILDEGVAWSAMRDGAITQFSVRWYVDRYTGGEGIALDKGVAILPSNALLAALERQLLSVDFGRLDIGDELYELDAFAIRAAVGELTDGLNRELWTRGRLLDLIETFRSPFGYGPMETTLTCRRTATARSLREGALALVNLPWLPNPGANARGGVRAVRVLERNETTTTIRLRVLDLGPDLSRATPTLGAFAGMTGNTANGLTGTVTLNAAGDPVTMQVAVTDASVTLLANVPASAWRTVRKVTASGSVDLYPLPSGRRVWIRGRSEGATIGGVRLPSAWVSPSPAFVDLTAMAAPSGLATSALTPVSVRLTWAVGSASAAVVVEAAEQSGTYRVIATLNPGSTTYDLVGTTNGVAYKARVRHFDGSGFSAYSAEVTWTASGTVPTAPAPRGLAVLGGLA